MAIVRKPKTIAPTAIDVAALINKGGSTPKGDATNGPVPVILRIPADLLARVDAALHHRAIKIPRHTWILEAIHEKLSGDHE